MFQPSRLEIVDRYKLPNLRRRDQHRNGERGTKKPTDKIRRLLDYFPSMYVVGFYILFFENPGTCG